MTYFHQDRAYVFLSRSSVLVYAAKKLVANMEWCTGSSFSFKKINQRSNGVTNRNVSSG